MSVPQQFLTEQQFVKCIEIKVPVVIESAEVQIVVDNHVTLPELAVKIDKIVASVRDLKGNLVFVDETQSGDVVLVPGFGHGHKKDVKVRKIILRCPPKQSYVNKNNEVRHTSEDIPLPRWLT